MEMFIRRLNEEQLARYHALTEHLTHFDLRMRLDSDVCLDHVLYNERTLDEVVQLLLKNRFLREECNYEQGYAMAQTLRPPNISRENYRALVEQCVLATRQ